MSDLRRGKNTRHLLTGLLRQSVFGRLAGYAKAEPLYQRALQINEKALSPNHPDLATDLNNLAVIYNARGHSTDAEPLYQRSLAFKLNPIHHTPGLNT